eukprot:12095380-Prorocentrum_lima.AAC.1
MQQYMKDQDFVKKENIHQVHPDPKPRVRGPSLWTTQGKGGPTSRRSFGLEQDEEGSYQECT